MGNWIGFALFALLFSSSSTQASQCQNPEVKKEDPYQFVRAVILSLSQVHFAMSPSQEASSGNTISQAADAIYHLDNAAKSYSCAASIVEGYTTSDNKAIRENATKVREAYLNLLNLNNQLLNTFREAVKALDGRSSRLPSTSEMVDIQVKRKQAANDLAVSAIGSLAIIIVSKPDDNEIRLCITQTERDQLLRLLESEFGEKLQRSEKEQTSPASLVAWGMYRGLAQAAWKFKSLLTHRPINRARPYLCWTNSAKSSSSLSRNF
jgi:hypothetical protein